MSEINPLDESLHCCDICGSSECDFIDGRVRTFEHVVYEADNASLCLCEICKARDDCDRQLSEIGDEFLKGMEQ